MFDLLLDDPIPSIDEDDSGFVTGSVINLDIPGNEVTLEIDFGDPLSPPQTQSFTVKDDGTGADLVAGDGIIEFSIPKQYLDDNPTGTPFDDYTVDVSARENVVSGTDAVFVIDDSGSTGSSAGFDVDGDGIISGFFSNDSILDAQVAAFKALNQDLINRGLGDTAKVSISAYSSGANLLDLDPVTTGVQTFTTPNADADGNGIRDVDQALDTLSSGGGTNFEAGLQQAITAINNAGTPPGGGSVIFLSDGFNNTGGSPLNEADTIRNTLGQNLRAFGVGSGSSLPDLQEVDPNAEKFTDISELLGLFSGTGSNVNQDSESATVTVNNVAPTVNLDQPSDINESETLTLTGAFQDPGSLDTFTAEIAWGDGSADSTFTLPDIGGLTAGDTFNSTTDSAVFTVTSIDGSAGEVGFSVDHTYQNDGSINIDVSVTDDDTGVGTAAVQLEVLDGTTPTIPVIPNLEFDPLKAVGVSGTDGDDALTGTEADEQLEGFAGNDVISGGAGTDLIDGGEGNDTVVYQFDDPGVVVNLDQGGAVDGNGDTDTIVDIENVIGSDLDDTIAGNDDSNNLSGRAGDDVISGLGGNDFIVGGAGADELEGGLGSDNFAYIMPSDGGDTIYDFETGVDKIFIVGGVFQNFSTEISGGLVSSEQFFSGAAASSGDHRFGYDSTTGDVLFDSDGLGGADATVLANIGANTPFTNTDITVV